jgi:hypothetical protein
MTDAELNRCIDILRASITRAFNHYDRGEAKQLGTVFHALLRERAARFDQCGDNAGQRRPAVTGLTRTLQFHDGGVPNGAHTHNQT